MLVERVLSRASWPALPVMMSCVLSASSVTVALAPQTPQATFRSTVRLIRLNLSVLDGRRVPVRGLQRGDFTIRVDGVSQSIAEVIEVHKESRPQTAGLVPDVRTNDRRDRRAFALILDDANTHNDARMADDVKRAARTFVNGLGAGDLIAVVFTWNGSHNQDFTTDRRLALRAVDRFIPGPGEQDPRKHPVLAEAALNTTVRHAISSLRQIPDVRTAVILLSPGPKRELTGAAAARDQQRDQVTGINSDFLDGSVHGVGLEEASYSTVPIYAVSTWGLTPPGPLDAVFRYDPMMQALKRGNDYLHTIANLSGGRAFTDRNDVSGAVRQILLENESHYLVGYYPSYPVLDGRFRRLQVEVSREGVVVVPSDRMVRTPAGRSADFQPSARAALAGILPADEFPLRLQTEAGPLENGRAAIRVTVGVNVPPPAEKAALECVLFDPGGLKEVTKERAEASVTAAGWQDIQLTMLAGRGSYVVRCGVHLRDSNRLAGVYGDVEVRK